MKRKQSGENRTLALANQSIESVTWMGSAKVFVFQQLRVDLAQERIDLALAVALGAADFAGQTPVKAQQGLLDRLGLARCSAGLGLTVGSGGVRSAPA